MESVLNEETKEINDFNKDELDYRFTELTNYIVRDYGYYIHSNIMDAGVEAVRKNRDFFAQISKFCGSKGPVYTEEKIVSEMMDFFQRYHEMLIARKAPVAQNLI